MPFYIIKANMETIFDTSSNFTCILAPLPIAFLVVLILNVDLFACNKFKWKLISFLNTIVQPVICSNCWTTVHPCMCISQIKCRNVTHFETIRIVHIGDLIIYTIWHEYLKQLDYKLVKVLQSAGHDLHAWITETRGTFSSTSESVLTWQFERLHVTTQPRSFLTCLENSSHAQQLTWNGKWMI